MFAFPSAIDEAVDGLVRALPKQALEDALGTLEEHYQERRDSSVIPLVVIERMLTEHLGNLRQLVSERVRELMESPAYRGQDVFQYCGERMQGEQNPFRQAMDAIVRELLDD